MPVFRGLGVVVWCLDLGGLVAGVGVVVAVIVAVVVVGVVVGVVCCLIGPGGGVEAILPVRSGLVPDGGVQSVDCGSQESQHLALGRNHVSHPCHPEFPVVNPFAHVVAGKGSFLVEEVDRVNLCRGCLGRVGE